MDDEDLHRTGGQDRPIVLERQCRRIVFRVIPGSAAVRVQIERPQDLINYIMSPSKSLDHFPIVYPESMPIQSNFWFF